MSVLLLIEPRSQGLFNEVAAHSIIGSLSTRVLRRGRQPEENISRARTVLSSRVLYYSSLISNE